MVEAIENKDTAEFEQLRQTKQWSRMRFLLEKMFPNEYLWAHAPYVAFQVAEREGLITKEEREQARLSYGDMWNYAGD
jgi:hypothetical protein